MKKTDARKVWTEQNRRFRHARNLVLRMRPRLFGYIKAVWIGHNGRLCLMMNSDASHAQCNIIHMHMRNQGLIVIDALEVSGQPVGVYYDSRGHDWTKSNCLIAVYTDNRQYIAMARGEMA